MQTVRVALGDRSYSIHIGGGLIDRPELFLPLLERKRVALITNVTVAPLYLSQLAGALAGQGIEVIEIILPDGEQYKNWETLNQIFDRLLDARCDRRTALIALGGGVIGDLAGFAAAIYQRGVPYIQVPTTLLAQVDSSVGGKTAVNHPRGKNMIGAFYQPATVVADTATLITLPDRELSAGLAEVIKYGLIRDYSLFEWLEANIDSLLGRNGGALDYAIRRCCEIKADIVALDERESGVRTLLNFGHTFGHAIEVGMGFGAWLHGEAVAAGMALAADLSRRIGNIDEAALGRILALLRRAGLPTDVGGIATDRFLELMVHDKKVADGRIRFVVLESLGSAAIRADIPPTLVRNVLERVL